MKRIALLAAAALVAGCADVSQPLAPASPAADEVGPGATPSLHEVDAGSHGDAAGTPATTESIEIHFVTDHTFHLPCVDEVVRLYGNTTHRERAVFLPDGSVKVTARGVGDDLTITGLETGRTWSHSSAESEIFVFHFEPDGQPKMYQHASMLRYHADGDYPDLYLRHTFHYQLDADGNLVVARETPDVFSCRATGQG